MTTDKGASRDLIQFVRRYIDLLEKHLGAIRNTMHETTDGVMKGIQDISDATALKRKQANEVIVKTYTDPSDEAKASMESVQADVNALLEEAQTQMGQGQAPTAGTPGTEQLRTNLRRSAGLFSKHMEALETLDGDLQEVLLGMMGTLSRDDIIAQRIEHVTQGLQALQMSLSYLLVDFETRCRPESIERFSRDLRSYIFRAYSMEEEKQIHYAVFPDDKKAS